MLRMDTMKSYWEWVREKLERIHEFVSMLVGVQRVPVVAMSSDDNTDKSTA